MRVGANARQMARIKKLHAEGASAGVIARTIQMTDQSLEKILAHLDGREERKLALDNNPEVAAIRLENAELAARLAKYEESEVSEEVEEEEDDDEDDS